VTAVDSGPAADAGRAGTVDAGGVRVTVAGDGTGVYDAPGLHLAVLPGGAGVYEDGQTRFSVNPDGTGTYESADLRVFVRPDGSGTFEDSAGADALRAWIEPDGSGSYRGPEGRVAVDRQGAVGGDADPAFAAAVAEVFAQGLPPFPPVPRITHVEPAGPSCGTVVRLDTRVLFAVDSAHLRPEGTELLQRVASLLGTLGGPDLDVVGHTDSSGGEAHNQALSERRAAAVSAELVALGVSPDSVRAVGVGETRPLRPDVGADGVADPAAQQLNRRVELVLRRTP
jgi:OOP family OmpA-OmpF porin